MRETITTGRLIAVVGWRDSNHSLYTRRLPANRVIFLDNSPANLGENIGLVVFTRFVDHTVVNRIKAKKSVHPIMLDTGKIKIILEACTDLFAQNKQCPIAMYGEVITEESTLKSAEGDVSNVALLDFLTQPQPTKELPKMTEIETFAKSFLAAAGTHQDGWVGSRTVGELRVASGVTKTTTQLVAAGWVDPITAKGKSKVGWYKVGRMMASTTNEPVPQALPETAAGRMEFLISQEPELLAEKARMEEQLVVIGQKLEMIASAKEMLGKIDQAFKN